MTEDARAEGVVSAASDAAGITIVRIFDAPREVVFQAWTTSEVFARWFGEPGSEIPLDRITMDARPGGAYSLVMLTQGMELPFFGEFREVVPPERVVMTIADRTALGDEVDLLSVDLEDLGADRTQMTFTQTGGHLSANEYSRAMRGELIFFDRLSELLKSRHDGPAEEDRSPRPSA